MQQQEILKNLSDRFNSLSMPNPSQRMVDGAAVTVNHPHEFLTYKFPVFEDFHNYFAELEPHYRGAGSFVDMLHNVYNDMREIPAMVNSLNQGSAPAKIDGIFKSMQLLNFLAQKKFALYNAKLAQEYKSSATNNKKK